jgi:predicted 3-demethylubiquinone-9 3-methyltransferase (glyoxalase superfamily)
MLPKIMPNLWFDTQAEEAAEFYVSVFKNSKIISVTRHPSSTTPSPVSTQVPMWVEFELDGVAFTALNGGQADFRFNESVSFIVLCDSQEEVDHYWEKLGDGGEYGVCGWLTDRYGVSWQIIPLAMNEMIADEDGARAERATQAMLEMTKIDIEALRQAFDG